MKRSAPIWMNPSKSDPDERILRFCAGRDTSPRPEADAVLAPCDLWTNRAHVIMLREREILSHAQAGRILASLARLEEQLRKGEWRLDPALEDVHANVEAWVAGDVGPELGGLLHTGRSRNDQVATDMRLWLRDVLLAAAAELCELVDRLISLAGETKNVVMPGMSHHQPGSVTTLGHWHACHAQAFLRDLARMRYAYALVNRCPLGATASFGTSWPLDRARTADLLGFDGVQLNSLDCIASRWEAEAEVGHALVTLLIHASMAAQDLILFATEPFGFVALDERHTTGSSAMPQKRNPDPCEVLKAKAAVVQQLHQALRAIPTGNVTGYNRDGQWTKYLIMDLVDEARDVPAVLGLLLAGARWDTARMREATERGFLTALDVAEALAQRFGLPFRQAYRTVSTAVTALRAAGGDRLTAEALNAALAGEGRDERVDETLVRRWCNPERAVRARRSAGSPAPAAVGRTRRPLAIALRGVRRWVERERQRLEERRNACRK